MKKIVKSVLLTLLTTVFLLISAVTPNLPAVMDSVLPEVNALGTEVASIDFSSGSAVTNNTTFVNITNNADEPYTESANIGGSSCRKIPAGKFMYIGVSKTAIPTSQRNLLIDVTYWDYNTHTLWFNYNGVTNNYAGADFSKNNSGGWATTTVVLSDAAFKAAMRDGSDIRLGFNNSDNYIKKITFSTGTLDPDSEPIPPHPSTIDSEFSGRSFAGYQVWHRAGETDADWVHWSYGKIAGPGIQDNINVCSFPDISEFSDSVLFNTNFASLGNGNPTKLYNSTNPKIINKHFEWMQTAGLDGVAVQRFVGGLGKSITKTDTHYLDTIKKAAEDTDRLFYICYDLNGKDDSIYQCFKNDWVYEIEQNRALTSSPNYATVNGKPVVEIWGIGYNFKISTAEMLNIINFFKSRGCYVVAGAPRDWRTNITSSGYDYTEVYKALDCISPWTVGVYNSSSSATGYYNSTMIADNNYCNQNGMDYLPVCFAGSGNWLNDDLTLSETDREGGNLLWTQVRNAKALGLSSVYFAMFDEFEENTNLVNAAKDYFDIPTDEYFETLAKNGVWTSSDYYLRLAGSATKLLKGTISNTATIPIDHSNGPLYFRNSFESRTTTFKRDTLSAQKTMPIDAGFYKNAVVTNQNMTAADASIIKGAGNYSPRTGLYTNAVTGITTGTAEHKYVYKTNEVKIKVKENMTLSYAKLNGDENGKYVAVDLLLGDGTRMSDVLTQCKPSVGNGTNGSWSNISVNIGQGSLIGKEITGILVAYESTVSGRFEAYIDDVIIETEEVSAVSADLSISAVRSTASNIIDGDTTKYTCTVRNNDKNNDTQGTVKVDFYRDNKLFDTVYVSKSIEADGYVTVTTDKEYIEWIGSHTIRAIISSDDDIIDDNSANDTLKARYIVTDD